jgi:signal transduction histidine kinase/ActR/RegA family two-component response regulator
MPPHARDGRIAGSSREPEPATAPQNLAEAQTFIRDIIALSTLPAMWMGARPDRIGESLLAVLETTVHPVVSYIGIPALPGTAGRAVERAFIGGRAAGTEETARLGEAARDWARTHDPDELLNWPLSHGQMARVCVYPLGTRQGGGVLAAGFLGEAPHSLSPLHRALLNVAANQALTACHNVGLQLQTEAARDEAQALYEVAAALAGELDLQEILQRTTDAATRLTQAHFGAFFHNVVDDAGESYSLYTLSGAPMEAFSKLGMPRNTPMFDHTFRGTGPLRLDDVRKDPRFGQVPPHHGLPSGHLPVVSYLAVPVKSRTGEVFGGLFLGHPEPAMFNERAERIAVGIATQAAVALENGRLFQQANRELERSQELTALLREGERRKDEFLATLSHELRNPLAPIRTAVALIKMSLGEPAKVESAARVIDRQASHLTRLIDDLLDVSRITRGKVELRLDRLNLYGVLEQAAEGVRPFSDAKQLRLTLKRPDRPILVLGDSVRVAQIVGNVLHNACKYSREGGRIQVELDEKDGFAEVQVRDEGVGIEKAQLERIFDMFMQVESATSRAPGGLGIGLSLSRSLAELHGGTLTASSDGLGKGSVFTLHLPLLGKAVPVGDRPRNEPDAILPPTPLRVLVVDDYTDALDMLSELVKSLGHDVRSASDGEEALRLARAELPDAVLLDLGLPRLDGYQVARQIRGLERGADVTLVAMTGWGQDQDKKRTLEAGFDLHLTKPADPEVLRKLLQDCAGRSRRR